MMMKMMKTKGKIVIRVMKMDKLNKVPSKNIMGRSLLLNVE
jgi:hypothetical protein